MVRIGVRHFVPVALVFFLAACGSLVSHPEGQTVTRLPLLESVDPCTLIQDGELRQFDILDHSKVFNVLDDVGCQWTSQIRSVVVSRGRQGLDFFDKRATWFTDYTRNMINGRSGARIKSSPTNTECSEVLEFSTGDVMVEMFYKRPDYAGPDYQYPPDPCGEAFAIATMIEPRLPK